MVAQFQQYMNASDNIVLQCVLAMCNLCQKQRTLQAAQMLISVSDAQKYGGLASSDELFSPRVLRIEASTLQASCSALVP